MCQYERWRMIRGIVAPPAFPLIVRPFSADRSEHVATKDEGAETLHCASGEPVIKTRFTPVFSYHPTKSPRWEKPLKNLLASQTERMLQTLSGTRSEAVKRDTESGNFYCGHQFLHRARKLYRKRSTSQRHAKTSHTLGYRESADIVAARERIRKEAPGRKIGVIG
jgi:hypothetical protein